jgi:hypothetical protein
LAPSFEAGDSAINLDTDWRDPSRYDLVVNLLRVTPDETTHRNVETIIVPGYQPKGYFG